MSPLGVEDALQLAIAHHQAGRLAEAESLYRSILQHSPRNAAALHLLGVMAGQLGKHDVAVGLIQQAISVDPANATFYSNLSPELVALNRCDEAIAAAQRAIELTPLHAEAWFNLGHARRSGGDLAGAIAAYREAIRLRPEFALAHAQLGIVLRRSGDVPGAIAAYRESLRLAPALPQTWNDLGIALFAAGQFDEAIASFQEAIRLKPNFGQAFNNLGKALNEIGRLRDSTAAYERALQIDPSFVPAHTGLIFTLLYRPDIAPVVLQQSLADFNRRYAAPLKSTVQLHTNDRSPGRRLRIGYVSGDFRNHVVARNILPFIRRHDHKQFELFFYSNTADEDDITEVFRRCADHWRPILPLSDEDAARQIRADGIDILIDLSLHSHGNRLLVFARKPAPVQVTFAGYPGSTGLEAMDYRLTDPYLDPEGRDARYVEKSIRLPHTFWCYETRGDEPGVGPLPSLAKGHLMFGCLNSFFKINEEVLALWSRVLPEVPGSRLMVQVPEGTVRAAFLTTLRSHGIDENRITIAPRLPHRQYLRLYDSIDIFLDTFPYNAHTTALDALFMGVPVVTLAGDAVVSRAGLSQLTNLGMEEWIAHTSDEFVQIAAGLASDPQRLAQIRASLRDRMQKSPLMDAEAFTRGIESAYRVMWKSYCEAPAP
jgi:predicted O-linked N-acetylglucosamine transferase (SPINDLY family)